MILSHTTTNTSTKCTRIQNLTQTSKAHITYEPQGDSRDSQRAQSEESEVLSHDNQCNSFGPNVQMQTLLRTYWKAERKRKTLTRNS